MKSIDFVLFGTQNNTLQNVYEFIGFDKIYTLKILKEKKHAAAFWDFFD